MTMRPSVRDAMLAAVPSLRAFAISLCGNVDRADDLVQETLLRAMANIHSFQPGTNMSAWLFTILRNLFRSEYRKRRREVEDTDGSYAESLKSHPEQQSRVEFEEFRVALAKSRVNRARTRLSDLLSINGADDFGPDHPTRAILSAGGRG
jgi:RNA polymerase sigma-70 factor (ECF subfamily)